MLRRDTITGTMMDRRSTLRLTPAGSLVLVSGAAGAVAARLAGIDEFVVLGVLAVLLVVSAAAIVRWWHPRMHVERSVLPRRVEVGAACSVTLDITNESRHTSLVSTLWDQLDGEAVAGVLIAPIPPGATRIARHHFTAPHRGVIQVGPLMIHSTDPFGLARIVVEDSAVLDVIVLPRIHHLSAPAILAGDNPDSGTRPRRTFVRASEEFATLREYLPGDDVRRVHWPSTARWGSPIVREQERPWQHRTTVVLDDRGARHDAASFERAVSAAASAIVSARRRDESVRWITASGSDTGFMDNDAAIEDALNAMAALVVGGSGDIETALLRSSANHPGGHVVLCVGALHSDEIATLNRIELGTRRAVVVACRERVDLRTPVATTVVYDEGTSLSHVWERATGGGGAR